MLLNESRGRYFLRHLWCHSPRELIRPWEGSQMNSIAYGHSVPTWSRKLITAAGRTRWRSEALLPRRTQQMHDICKWAHEPAQRQVKCGASHSGPSGRFYDCTVGWPLFIFILFFVSKFCSRYCFWCDLIHPFRIFQRFFFKIWTQMWRSRRLKVNSGQFCQFSSRCAKFSLRVI